MKIKYKINTKGYVVLQRKISDLLETLSFAELGAYICFVMQADWDRKHEFYGVVIRDDDELAKAFGRNYSTMRRLRKSLLTKGLLIEVGGLTKVTNMTMFEIATVKTIQKKKLADVHKFYLKSEEELTKALFELE